jgi:DNA replication protein DnaC
MAGGHATAAGVMFQLNVASWLGVHALCEKPIPQLSGLQNSSPQSLYLESEAPVDDLRITTVAGGNIFLNVKTTVSLSSLLRSPLGSVVDQFVRQHLACRQGEGNLGWDRPLDQTKDCLVLAVSSARTLGFVDSTRPILERIRNKKSILPVDQIATTQKQKVAYETWISLVQQCWTRHTGIAPTDGEVCDLLSCVRLIQLDFDGATVTEISSLLTATVVENRNDASAAWNVIVNECARLAQLRSGADSQKFRECLRAGGIPLREKPAFARDIERLKQITKRTLETLSRYSRLSVPTENGTIRVEIDRNCVPEIVISAATNSFLLVGAPGAGKSGAIYSVANSLIKLGHPVVVLAVDEWSATSREALRQELELKYPLNEVLDAWNGKKPGILIIDALDASRGNSSDEVFFEVIASILDRASGWNVLASIRKFDLRYGVKYQDLFRGSPASKLFRDVNFSNVRHFDIPRLSEQELAQVWEKSPRMAVVHDSGTLAFRDLLTSPFNLFLLSTVLPPTGDSHELKSIGTQVELLERYWAYRVESPADNHRINRVRLLRSATEVMVNKRQLFVRGIDLAGHDGSHLEQLMQSGILLDHHSQGRISFSHHMLFDYAVARTIMMDDDDKALIERLALSDDQALLLAPAAMIALRIVWGEHLNRHPYWELAIGVAAQESAGSFSRMLPARVAAELIALPDDISPLTKAISINDARKDAALFLVRHVFGTLLANVILDRPMWGNDADPWCGIVRKLCETDMASLTWPMKAVIGHWTDTPASLSSQQKKDLGAAARLLLRNATHDWKNHRNYDQGAVVSGIQAIARTFETAKSESEVALEALLAPDRVAVYGHIELFRFAIETKHLIASAPQLVHKLYLAAYCAPLPSREEISHIGSSKILSLTSNKRQDIEGVQYQLEGHLGEYLQAAPTIAIKTVIDILDYRIPAEHRIKDDTPIDTFEFLNCTARFREDLSAIWWTPSGSHNRGEEKLLDIVLRTLLELDEIGSTHAVETIIINVVQFNVWASLWSVLLIAGQSRPATIGRAVLPLLRVPSVLGAHSTAYPAGELLRILGPHLERQEQGQIETAIWQIESEHQRDVLIGCLSGDNVTLAKTTSRLAQLEAEGKSIQNRPPFSLESGWSGDENWWYREGGIDISKEPFASIHNAVEAVKVVASSNEQSAGPIDVWIKNWPTVLALHEILLRNDSIPERLEQQAWDQLAEAAEKAALSCKSASELEKFQSLHEIVRSASNHKFPPVPQHDPAREHEFAKHPSWGRPAPRIEAAAATMALARANGAPSQTYRADILRLIRDPAVEIRHTIASRLNMLCEADPELMQTLIDVVFDEENNLGILSFFLGALHRVIGRVDAGTAEKLLSLDSRISSDEEEDQRDLRRQLVTSIVRLWMVNDLTKANSRIEEWIGDPSIYSSHIQTMLSSLRDTLLMGKIDAPQSRDSTIRTRAIQIFSQSVTKAAEEFRRLALVHDRTPSEQKQLENTFRVLDTATHEIYFGSGAYERGKGHESIGESDSDLLQIRRRFLSEINSTLECLADVPYPSVTHYLLETLEAFIPEAPEQCLSLMIRSVHNGGASGGYQLESMGADLLVRLVRRFLADYAPMISGREEFRTGLVKALDYFAEAGWPEARQLVYQLPEMLR